MPREGDVLLDRRHHRLRRRLAFLARPPRDVPLVGDDHESLAGVVRVRGHGRVLAGRPLGGVEHEERHVALLDVAARLDDREDFRAPLGPSLAPDPGRVHEAEPAAARLEQRVHAVPRRAGDLGDDRALGADERVDERRLPDVRAGRRPRARSRAAATPPPPRAAASSGGIRAAIAARTSSMPIACSAETPRTSAKPSSHASSSPDSASFRSILLATNDRVASRLPRSPRPPRDRRGRFPRPRPPRAGSDPRGGSLRGPSAARPPGSLPLRTDRSRRCRRRGSAGRPGATPSSSSTSRVTPGRSCTSERRRRTIRLKSADFPTFGRPAMTTRKGSVVKPSSCGRRRRAGARSAGA